MSRITVDVNFFDAAFEEIKHPRGEGGQFSSSGGSIGKPRGRGKALEEMSEAELRSAEEKHTAAEYSHRDRVIAKGLGHIRWSELRSQHVNDPDVAALTSALEKTQKIQNEMYARRRHGSLQKPKRNKFTGTAWHERSQTYL